MAPVASVRRVLGALLLALALVLPSPAAADGDQRSPNMSLVARVPAPPNFTGGTDLAFWGDLAVLGVSDAYGPSGGFRLVDISEPRQPRVVSDFVCPAYDNDVAVWKHLVFVAVQSPRAGEACDAPPSKPIQEDPLAPSYAGIRIVSIADRARPVQVAFVRTNLGPPPHDGTVPATCRFGPHTHTLVPDEANDRVVLYAFSVSTCDPEPNLWVVEVPLQEPARARVRVRNDLAPGTGCHDATVHMARKLVAAACIRFTQLWDITDPANPQLVPNGRIENPAISLHHSSTFSMDGSVLAISDEASAVLFGQKDIPACAGGAQERPTGALWFYDIRDVGPVKTGVPVPKGTFAVPRASNEAPCYAHYANTVPTTNGRDILVIGLYRGGTSVVDFTNPAKPLEIAHYVPVVPAPGMGVWSAYWYRGFVYAHHTKGHEHTEGSRGLEVLAVDHQDLAPANTIKLKRLNPQTMEPLP